MLINLDGNKNKKGKPNENFSHDVLELFSLGQGHVYTKADIQVLPELFLAGPSTKRELSLLIELISMTMGIKNS